VYIDDTGTRQYKGEWLNKEYSGVGELIVFNRQNNKIIYYYEGEFRDNEFNGYG